MAEKYYQSIGRRKTAIAQVRLVPGGNGVITVNGRPMEEYFGVGLMQENVVTPLKKTGKLESFDVTVKAIGGGLQGQSDAIKLGIARALVKYDDSLRSIVKIEGLLTRDPRKKERKKFGKRGARRSTQWRKR
jgi:small subunit ribosomal protein S9